MSSFAKMRTGQHGECQAKNLSVRLNQEMSRDNALQTTAVARVVPSLHVSYSPFTALRWRMSQVGFWFLQLSGEWLLMSFYFSAAKLVSHLQLLLDKTVYLCFIRSRAMVERAILNEA